MPYKDPERKRQWEREHREHRNARRRNQHLTAQGVPSLRTMVAKPAPDPIPAKKTKNGWKVVVGIGAFVFAVGLGILAALDGASASGSDSLGPS